MKFKFSMPALNQVDILRDSRKTYAKPTAKHVSKKAYKRQKKVVDD